MERRGPDERADGGQPQPLAHERVPADPGLLDDDAAGHIIDPVAGAPLKSLFAVSIIAKSATVSDALSTTLTTIFWHST